MEQGQQQLKTQESEVGFSITRQKLTAYYYSEKLGEGIALDMVFIPSGEFQMGSPKSELRRQEREGPQRQVSIEAFFMGKYPVTQAQWKVVAALPQVNRELKPEPSNFKGNNCPVEKVSWDEAVEFCDRLSTFTEREYRLPTEAEWEYACRAGTTTPFHYGETITTDLANYRGQDWEYEGKTYPGNYGPGPYGIFRKSTTDVGSFPANAFGLYDMHGNVWEWCLDHWHENYEGAPKDGSAWLENGDNSYRLLRGGSWGSVPELCRSAYRGRNLPGLQISDIGFRVVCSPPRTQ